MAEIEQLEKAANEASDAHEAALREALTLRKAAFEAQHAYYDTGSNPRSPSMTRETFQASQSAYTSAMTAERQAWTKYLTALRALNNAQHDALVRLLEQSRNDRFLREDWERPGFLKA